MAWFWDKKTQTKREIHSITKVGNLPVYEVEFKGRGPLGGREVRTYNLAFEKDANIHNAIKNYANEKYDDVLEFSMKFAKRGNDNTLRRMKHMVFNKNTFKNDYVDFDTFMKHVKNYK